jgi:hypothetical protein
MLAHMKGREGNLLFGTHIRSLRMSGPLNGALDAPAAGHPLCHFIPRSGLSSGSDLSIGFRLRTLSFSRPPLAIEGPVGDMASVSLVVAAGAMSEEYRRWVNLVYQVPYCV